MEQKPLSISDALTNIDYLFIDTAPIIYFVEQNPSFSALVEVVFDKLDEGEFTAVISPVTIAECLMYPIRNQNQELQNLYMALFTRNPNTVCTPIDANVGQKAAELKARYNLKTPDALQIATAITGGCDGFLTNDKDLKRVVEISVMVLKEYSVI